MSVMDVLSDILNVTQLSAKPYFFRGVGRWHGQVQYSPQVMVYAVVKRQCYFREGESEDAQLRKEDENNEKVYWHEFICWSINTVLAGLKPCFQAPQNISAIYRSKPVSFYSAALRQSPGVAPVHFLKARLKALGSENPRRKATSLIGVALRCKW